MAINIVRLGDLAPPLDFRYMDSTELLRVTKPGKDSYVLGYIDGRGSPPWEFIPRPGSIAKMVVESDETGLTIVDVSKKRSGMSMRDFREQLRKGLDDDSPEGLFWVEYQAYRDFRLSSRFGEDALRLPLNLPKRVVKDFSDND